MDYRIFIVCTYVLLHVAGCTWGCTGTVRESALKVDSGGKILCQTRKLNLPQWHASLTHDQLSYIHTCWKYAYTVLTEYSVGRR